MTFIPTLNFFTAISRLSTSDAHLLFCAFVYGTLAIFGFIMGPAVVASCARRCANVNTPQVDMIATVKLAYAVWTNFTFILVAVMYTKIEQVLGFISVAVVFVSSISSLVALVAFVRTSSRHVALKHFGMSFSTSAFYMGVVVAGAILSGNPAVSLGLVSSNKTSTISLFHGGFPKTYADAWAIYVFQPLLTLTRDIPFICLALYVSESTQFLLALLIPFLLSFVMMLATFFNCLCFTLHGRCGRGGVWMRVSFTSNDMKNELDLQRFCSRRTDIKECIEHASASSFSLNACEVYFVDTIKALEGRVTVYLYHPYKVLQFDDRFTMCPQEFAMALAGIEFLAAPAKIECEVCVDEKWIATGHAAPHVNGTSHLSVTLV